VALKRLPIQTAECANLHAPPKWGVFFDDGPALRLRAFSLRDNLTAYDAAYVALAEALRCPLVTRDAQLAHSSGHDVEIRAL
jgi:predicted nucleic acid-binding protein